MEEEPGCIKEKLHTGPDLLSLYEPARKKPDLALSLYTYKSSCWPQHSHPTVCTSSGYPGVLLVDLGSPTCIHIKPLLVFTPLFVHVLQSKSQFPSFRLQIGWFSLPEQLLRIVFYLHRSVGGPLHHYLLPADDRMIRFLLGFSMILLAKSYWKYSSKIFFFSPNLLILQHLYVLKNWGSILLTYIWEGRIQFTDWDIYF